ncbi:MAG: FAD-dependent oxidoreductase [Solirubrobacteraceae bacterium]
MSVVLTAEQRETLRAVCDTVVPSLERSEDPEGFFARSASAVGVDGAVEQLLSTAVPPEQAAGLLQLLDALGEMDFARASQLSREQLLRNVALSGPLAAAGVGALVSMTLFLHYGAPDPGTGQNPSWKTFGYPGPIGGGGSASDPRGPRREITPLTPAGERLDLEADVCIVGSGAGGSVIAASLAAQGLDVVVLEAGGQFDEADFNQLELWAYENLYWRGGPTATADLNVTLQAGAALGGGTVVNWTNCLRTTGWVREQWAVEHGLEGLDGASFERHLDAVLERLGATDACSDYNGPTERMCEGAERLGWHFKRVVRNADPERYDPASAGYMGFGDQSGSKRSADKTFLLDAVRAGAKVVVRCTATRILCEHGCAAGVEARWLDPQSGRLAAVNVRSPRVVVAAGALESPALLLRSQIGGAAVGRNLRLHPCTALYGLYDEDQRAWWGPPHAGLLDEFADVEDGYGFLVETAQYAPALVGSALPFTTAAAHKQLLSQARYGATFIGLLRERGGGRVQIDAAGQSVPTYSISDQLDVRNTHRSIAVQARLHEAAGAGEVYALGAGLPRWRRGEDLERYIAAVQRLPLRAGGMRLFSAHQMGTCRMGSDPATSVAGPWGELHDTPGVWIGDASAFPSASGTNPMITVMALAHRTAEAIAQAPLAGGRAAEPHAAAHT